MKQGYDCIIFTDYTDPIISPKTLGAYKIAQVLREQGHTCLVVDHTHSFQFEEVSQILDAAVGSNTKFIGFSIGFFANVEQDGYGIMNVSKSFFPQGRNFEDQFIDKLCQLNPNTKIVIGGPQTLSNQISNRHINYIVMGYAEVSVINLMNHLCGKEDLNKSYKNIYGITVIDDRDAEEHDFKNCAMTWLPEDVVNARVLPIEVARGCVFNCSFCQFPMRGKKAGDLQRSSEQIYRELKHNYDNYGIKTYFIVDDTFNDNEEKLDSFLSAVKRLDFTPTLWCYARLDLFYNKLHRVDKLFDMGLRSVYLGIETLNRRTGLAVGKGMHSHKGIETVRKIREKYNNDLQIRGNFIVGLPHEDSSSIMNTMNLILTDELPLHHARFTPLKILRNANWWSSDIDLDFKKFGYTEFAQEELEKDLRLSLTWTVGADWLPWKNDCMTFAEAAALAEHCNQTLRNNNKLHFDMNTMWELIDQGHEFEYLKNLNILDISKDQLLKGNQTKIAKYKQDFLKLLTNKI